MTDGAHSSENAAWRHRRLRLHRRARARARVRDLPGATAVRDRRRRRHLRGAPREGARRAPGRAHLREPRASSSTPSEGASTSSTSPRRPRDHARDRARRARRAGCTCSARSRSPRPVERRARMLDHAREVRRVLFPCHNYKHAPVIKAVRQILDAGLIGPVQARHAPHLSQHARQGRRRVAARLAARAPLLRRRHRHGPRQPHLLSGVRLARQLPDRDHREDVDARRLRHRGQLLLRDDVPERARRRAHLTWTAGVRKVIYTIHGERGAIRVEDDDVELAVMNGAAATGQVDVGDEEARRSRRSGWTRATSAGSGRSSSSSPPRSPATSSSARRPRTALRCIELITHGVRFGARSARIERPLVAGEDAAVIDLAFSLGPRGDDARRRRRVCRARVARGRGAASRASSEPGARRSARQAAMEMAYWAMRPVGSRLRRARRHRQRRVTLASRWRLGGARGRRARRRALRRRRRRSACVSSLATRSTGSSRARPGTATDAGEVLDAAVDRYVELFFLGGLAFFRERIDAFALVLTLAATARRRSW